MTETVETRPTMQWDAGEAGCAQLIVGLKAQLDRIEPGKTLEVVARSAGAAIDIYVWCRMTGHLLLAIDGPVFVIQRNGK
jgi:TusA-related sulfurtransferase